jgi:hypothetical protein
MWSEGANGIGSGVMSAAEVISLLCLAPHTHTLARKLRLVQSCYKRPFFSRVIQSEAPAIIREESPIRRSSAIIPAVQPRRV